jgi:tetratricopeptide (TPR) repeat protein
MKSFRTLIAFAAAFLLSCTLGNAASTDNLSTVSNKVWATFDRFATEKHDLARTLAKKHKVVAPSQVDDFFAAALSHDWNTSSNLFYAMRVGAGTRTPADAPPGKKWMPPELWDLVLDTYGAFELFHGMNPKFVKMFGAEIVQGIPAGSIYFGGNDPGFFLISAFCESQSEGRPFFTISQNRLRDSAYLGYVADMYGDKIHVVDTNDSQKSFAEYSADAKERMLHDQDHPNAPRQVKPGEDVDLDELGNVQVSGQLGAIAIYGGTAKALFDKNPTKEFYVAESFPLDWMFPHLTPSGLIMKINRAEIPELTEDELKKDHGFWSKATEPLVGNWIAYDTSVKELTAFAEKVYLHHDYDGFKGDEDFVRDEAAQKAFSKLRSSIAGIYSWRLGQPPSGGAMPKANIATGNNRSLIEREADFAFKQAFALCPSSPEAVFRYVQLLVNMGRVNDALAVAETAQKLDPQNSQFGFLIKNLESIRAQSSGRNQSSANIEGEVAKLEGDINPGTTNFIQQFELAQKLIQLGRNDRAYEVLDGVLSNPHASLAMVMTVAKAYNDLGQPQRLQGALEKMTQLAPDSPGAWYDLSASHATMSQDSKALDSLKKALALNSKRLAADAIAQDIRLTLRVDERFTKLRSTPEYRAIVEKP